MMGLSELASIWHPGKIVTQVSSTSVFMTDCIKVIANYVGHSEPEDSYNKPYLPKSTSLAMSLESVFSYFFYYSSVIRNSL